MKGFLFLLFNFLAFLVVGQESKLEIYPLTNNSYVYTTYRDYKGSLFPSNGMFLITDLGAILIDTPWDTTQFQPLLDFIKNSFNKDVLFCISTHSHSDRTAGINYFNSKGIATYTSYHTYQLCLKNEGVKPSNYFILDTTFVSGPTTIKTYFAGEGHTSDNIVIWIEDEKTLYGGCLVKSVDALDLGYLGDANPTEWISTIKKIQIQYPQPTFIIPGHQSWISLNALNHTIELLNKYNK